MEPPERLWVPTCIGCGAMSQLGTCETSCSEHKLDLVRAAAHDTIAAGITARLARIDAFTAAVQELGSAEPDHDHLEDAYRSAQRAARTVLRRHPDVDGETIDLSRSAEHATTWWCAECGGIDAPQPCLGICIWRSVEWVERTVYEGVRERSIIELEREQQLRRILQKIAWITPRSGHWEQGWRLLQREARQVLAAHGIAA
jgi:hypothetical protein